MTKKTYGGVGVLKKEQQKYTIGNWVSNASFMGKNYNFNFHIPLDMKHERLSLLKQMLLARVLLNQ